MEKIKNAPASKISYGIQTKEKIEKFVDAFVPIELEAGSQLLVYKDEKSGAHYLVCHLRAEQIAENSDLEASLDINDEDEIYKLNRDVTEDKSAFVAMEADALLGRSFEDLVVEYDTTYREERPLKIYGGQHRVRAITKAVSAQKKTPHGVRVYFDLTREQKVEIATVNNTSIAVPNDLLDRMREQLLGTELRDWCQRTGLLSASGDFSDRRSPDVPTVRVGRTLVVNYLKGIAGGQNVEGFHQPIICKAGGVDENYAEARKTIDWNSAHMLEMGKQFARLHMSQRDTVSKRATDNYSEFARKTMSLAVVSSWSFAAGLFHGKQDLLKQLYALPESAAPPEDPLNAKALSQARLKGTDPDTYRGLGTRSSPNELGRMLEVFLVYGIKAQKKRITKELANAAIQSYEAKRAVYEAAKAMEKI